MYLDPGFGSMIIQIVVTVFAAGGAFLYMMRDKVKNLFKKKNKTDEADAVVEESAVAVDGAEPQ